MHTKFLFLKFAISVSQCVQIVGSNMCHAVGGLMHFVAATYTKSKNEVSDSGDSRLKEEEYSVIILSPR
jgi:hypothetical protein